MRRALAIAELLAAAAAVGCGGAFHARLHLVYDFTTNVAAARPLAEVGGVDLGDERQAFLLGRGWSGSEVEPRTGVTFTWADARVAELELPLVRTHLDRLKLRCWPFLFEGAPRQTVEVEVNGVALGVLELAPEPTTYSLEVPDGVLRIGGNHVLLRFAYAEPASRHDLRDSRTLAAAFDFIRLGEAGVPAAPAKPRAAVAAADGSLTVPAGRGLVFTLTSPADGVLELAAGPPVGQAWGEVWLRRAGRPGTERVAWVDPSRTEPIRWRVPLDVPAGTSLQVGFATMGGGDPPGKVTWERPRLLGRGRSPPGAANLLLLEVDTLRADHVGAYGGAVPTPNVDALAAAGVRFKHAYSHIPITGPSHATIFTSRLPFEHGVHNNAQILDAGYQTLAEDLRSWGRTTAAFISLGVLQGRFGFDQGFTTYRDDFPRDWMKDAREVDAEVLEWLDDDVSEPFFAWIHYSDPHEPYTPPGLDYPKVRITVDGRPIGVLEADGRTRGFAVSVAPGTHTVRLEAAGAPQRHTLRFPTAGVDEDRLDLRLDRGWEVNEKRFGPEAYDTRLPATLSLRNTRSREVRATLELACKELLSVPEIRERYAGEVAYVDRQIGSLMLALRQRGLLANTLVVFLADHGEALGDHNHVGHISQLYDSLLRVPLILSMPGRLPAGLVVDEPVGLMDVAPTVADLLGMEAPVGARGRSLVPLVTGAGLPPRPLVAETYRPEAATDKRALIADGYTLIHSQGDREWVELYDLRSDPDELDDLAARRPDLVGELSRRLGDELAVATHAAARDAELSPGDAARLRALGYLK